MPLKLSGNDYDCRKTITVGLNFENTQGLKITEFDLHVFITDANYQCLSMNHWLWYFNQKDPSDSVKLGSCNGYQKSVELVLSKLPDDVQHIVICCNSFEGNANKQELYLVDKYNIDIIDESGKKLIDYEFSKVSINSNSIIFLEFKRIGEKDWKITPYGNGNNMSLANLCSGYGIKIQSL